MRHCSQARNDAESVMAKDDPHFRLRIPSELKEVIELHAERNQRSSNAEIVYALEQFYPVPVDQGEVANLLEKVEEAISSGHPSRDDFELAARMLRRNLQTKPGKEGTILPDTLEKTVLYYRNLSYHLAEKIDELEEKLRQKGD